MRKKKGYSPYRKGKYYEYRLAQELKKEGFFVVRSPASGRRGQKLIYPDIIAIYRGKACLIECKMLGDKRNVSISRSQFERMLKMKKESGCPFFLFIYYKDIGEWRGLPVEAFDWETASFVVFSRHSIIKKGITPHELKEFLESESFR